MRNEITNILKLVNELPKPKAELFKRIFHINEVTGKLVLPKAMQKWATDRFGSLSAVEKQKVIKIDNLITYEGSLFNELRSKRPIIKESANLDDLLKVENCQFCDPLNFTPEDVFGRIKGRYCTTGSNVAKYDGWHGLIIFNDHSPFNFSLDKTSDYIDTALKWFKEANRHEEKSIYPMFMWNCLWKAAASIIHGHAQLTLSRTPYSKHEHLRKAAEFYEEQYDSNYFNDLFELHSSLGLGFSHKNTKIMSYLTPIKEKEIVMFSSSIDKSFKEAIYKSLSCFYKLGVRSFNLVILMPPIVLKKEWNNFPFVVRMVDRGDLLEKSVDIGSMELYANNVIATDPFKVISELKSLFS